jgi:hypothetical protein
MPHPNALSLATQILSICCNKFDENSMHYTTVPFGVVVSSLNSHQTDWGSNPNSFFIFLLNLTH